MSTHRPFALRSLFAGLGAALSILLSACGPSGPAPATGAAGSGLTKVRFQTDWYPQAEHGGYYQALAKGFYREVGLDVEILPGGPGAFVGQKVATGQAEFGMGRSDDHMLAVAEGIPLLMVSALMQRDPQALLLHDDDPVKTFTDLNGRTIMAVPGSAWISYVQARYQVKFNVIPLNYGLAQFMSDKTFIQQCFVTNEPFYVAQAGGKPRTLLLASSGYDPYRIIFTNHKLAREKPDLVRAFVAASIRGWDDFLSGDPAPGKKIIGERNEKMTSEFMDFTIRSLRESQLISGRPDQGERTGLLTRKRLEDQMKSLVELKMLSAPLPLEKAVSFDFLPADLQALAKAP